MSDQTSPPDQPTPTPAEGAGDGTELGETAPPPPPENTTVDTAPPPPPEPPKKSRRGLIIGLIAGFVVLAVVAAVAVVLVVTKGEDKHSITMASTAGGMKRDKAEETKLKKELDATDKQFETQFKGTSVTYGLYTQDDSDRGPEGQLLFLGFKFKTPSEKNPANFVDKLKDLAKTNQLEVTNIATGDAGGKAVCLGTPSSAAQKNASCLWVTRDSAGGLFPNTQGYDSKQLSKIMTDLRSDVEKTE